MYEWWLVQSWFLFVFALLMNAYDASILLSYDFWDASLIMWFMFLSFLCFRVLSPQVLFEVSSRPFSLGQVPYAIPFSISAEERICLPYYCYLRDATVITRWLPLSFLVNLMVVWWSSTTLRFSLRLLVAFVQLISYIHLFGWGSDTMQWQAAVQIVI
jgi:hypothetical protein